MNMNLLIGTVLKAAQYFDDSTPIPPTLAFGLGSLGFLAPFNPEETRSMISRYVNMVPSSLSSLSSSFLVVVVRGVGVGVGVDGVW